MRRRRVGRGPDALHIDIEHLKEFATVKAIGGRNSDIYAIIGKQAAIAAVAGFALGAAMAYALRPAMEAVDLKLDVTPRFAASVFVGTLALCLGASAISCRKVATLDPAIGVPRVKTADAALVCGAAVRYKKRKGSDL